MSENICEQCLVKGTELIRITSADSVGIKTVCYDCFSLDVASKAGIKLDSIRMEVFTVQDRNGKDRRFNISRVVFPVGIRLEAKEITEDGSEGYKIAVHGDLYCDQKELYKRLNKKINMSLSKQYIEERTFEERKYKLIAGNHVVGRIEWDAQADGEVPLVMVDGEVYSWDEFGKLMMSYESFQFKLEFFDATDDVE